MTQVIVGQIRENGKIEANDGSIAEYKHMNNRAMWAWLRFQMGQDQADEAYRQTIATKVPKSEALPQVWKYNAESFFGKGGRELQYILSGSELVTVATTQHLITPPEQVLKVAHRLMPDLHKESGFAGVIKELEEIPGLKVNFQIDPGDIFTNRAIGVGFAIRVIMCTNPLSFLGSGSLTGLMGSDSGAMNKIYDKILRFRNEDELEEKLRKALEGITEKADLLKERVRDTKEEAVPDSFADTILTAFPVAYDASQETVKQIKARYKFENKTLWGMAQATSYVAQHRNAKTQSEKINQGLAASGAAMLFIKEKVNVQDRCLEWLKNVKKIDLAKWV